MRKLLKILPLLLPAFPLVSCSIKESRAECPCYALIDLDEYAELSDAEDILVTVRGGGVSSNSEVKLTDCLGCGHEEKVGRSSVIFCSASGYGDMNVQSDSVRAPGNMEWGKIFSDGQIADCDDDICVVRMRPHKEYCTVIFLVVGVPSEGLLFDMRVRANSDGVRLRDSKPLEGAYTAYVSGSFAGSVCSVRIPRQEDDNMVLDLLEHREDRTYTAEDILTSFPLGRMIRAQGFSWTKSSLDDVYITIDYSRMIADVSIIEWNEKDIEESI